MAHGLSPHRLLTMLSLVLAVALMVPETAGARHKRPFLRISLAGIADTFTPALPASFNCSWNESPHDYECDPGLSPAPGPPAFWLKSMAGPFDPADNLALLSPSSDYDPDHDGEVDTSATPPGWSGRFPLASPEIAPSFSCENTTGTDPTSVPLEQRAGLYTCSFSFRGWVHRFTLDEVVSTVWESTSPQTDQWVLPCDPAPAPCPPPAPETSITAGPFGSIASRNATFAFSSSKPNSTFECLLDGGSWKSCAAPAAFAGLAEGGHSFRVRATDVAGNVDPTPAARDWRVDTAAPNLRISGRPVRLSRSGRLKLRVHCPGSELSGPCEVKLTLKTARRVRVGFQRRIITVGRARAALPAGQSRVVSVRVSRRARRVVERLRRVSVRVSASTSDRAGNVALTTRTFTLRAPKRR